MHGQDSISYNVEGLVGVVSELNPLRQEKVCSFSIVRQFVEIGCILFPKEQVQLRQPFGTLFARRRGMKKLVEIFLAHAQGLSVIAI